MKFSFTLIIALCSVLAAAASMRYPKNQCMDIENRIQPFIRYGFPHFETVEGNKNCVPQYKLVNGECKAWMSADNNCKSYCEVSHGWFWGLPRTMAVQSWHNICQRADQCNVNVGINGPIGETVSITLKDETNASNATSIKKALEWREAWTSSHTFTAGVSAKGSMGVDGSMASLGPNKIPLKGSASMDVSAGYSFSYGISKARSRSFSRDWTAAVTTSQTYGIQRSRTKSLSYSSGGSWSKEPWAAEYCGSWYAVPLVGVTCGRGAMGELERFRNGDTRCRIGKDGVFDTCDIYAFKHDIVPDDPRTRTVFVLRDCKEHFILPGEYQQDEFAYSLSSMQDYYLDHVSRWGIRNLPAKPEDDLWTFQRKMDMKLKNFTKTIGVVNYNFKYCGRGEYCVQLRLSENRCYDIPRGHVSESSGKSADVYSATVMPGHCCVLFSRHECLGQPQRLMPGFTSLEQVEYLGMAHSVVCGVSEYCGPQKSEGYASSGDGHAGGGDGYES